MSIKAGDRYIVKTYTIDKMPEHWVPDMTRYMGKEMKVKRVSTYHRWVTLVDGGGWSWEEDDLEPIPMKLDFNIGEELFVI